MRLVASAALAKVPVNTERIFDAPDNHYALFIQACCDEVAEAQDEINRQTKV